MKKVRSKGSSISCVAKHSGHSISMVGMGTGKLLDQMMQLEQRLMQQDLVKSAIRLYEATPR
jgi:hypothetical protein